MSEDVDAAVAAHLHRFFNGHSAERVTWLAGPMVDLLPRFHVLRFAPGPRTPLWTYCSVGAWAINAAAGSLEFLVMVETPAPRIVELVTMLAHYHVGNRLGVGHTLPIGEPWQPGSECDCFLISKPYPFGPELEICDVGERHVHIVWGLPITERERRLCTREGLEDLERRFESAGLRYWDVTRASVA